MLRRIALAAAGALAAQTTLRALRRAPRAQELERTNFHGRTVSLAGGPALAVAASTTAALGAPSVPAAAAALTAGLGAGGVGFYDDLVGSRPEQKSAKGFRGHLGALREGRVTSGLVKIAGVGAAGLAASALLFADDRGGSGRSGRIRSRRRPGRRGAAGGSGRAAAATEILLGAGVIAGTANLVNLLDLRPGRALKAGLILSGPLLPGAAGGLVTGPVGAVGGLLPEDLGEEIMLGDAGANALGALLGVALAARTGPVGRAALLAALAGLTAASEKVSFTKVIEATPGLRELDALGRRRG
ncbi:hypothetical protein GCM10023322_51110 [Rugosimonospora acidiphila]|uniref:Glycosyl transferase family 4 n=1 Tax=Rugosimonospora acidiphila TaxID=556531 RepID=A0ABP9S8N9_9ACTN